MRPVCLFTAGLNITVIRLSIKQSKTDPFHKGIQFFLGKTDHNVCLIAAILPCLALRGSKPDPLIMTYNSSSLTRHYFSTSLSAILSAAGVDQKRYSTHSFRIGAATSAKLVGMSELDIKKLGRWRSNTFECYIRTPREYLASFSWQLSLININVMTVIPPASHHHHDFKSHIHIYSSYSCILTKI